MYTCHIMGAGSYYGGFPAVHGSDSLIIAADGGADTLRSLGIAPDVLLGDFDSSDARESDGFAGPVITLPHVKDDTDTLAAIKYGLEHNCTTFHIWGGVGGRSDHTAANIQCAAWLATLGKQCILHGESCDVTALCGNALPRVTFDGNINGYISVFSHTDISRGVTLSGLYYPLEDAVLTNLYPLGVSNEFCGVRASVSVKEGVLLVYYPAGAIPASGAGTI